MKKNELIRTIASESGLSTTKANQVLNIFLQQVTKTLQSGQSLQLKTFGTFSVVDRNERKYTNIISGEEYTIPAHKSVKFKASNFFKEDVKDAPIDYSKIGEFKQAKRLAKIVLADIKLYHKDLLQKSKEAKKIVPELEKILTDARKTYNSRVALSVRETVDYYDEEIKKLFRE